MNVFLRTMASCLVFLFSLWCEPQLSSFFEWAIGLFSGLASVEAHCHLSLVGL